MKMTARAIHIADSIGALLSWGDATTRLQTAGKYRTAFGRNGDRYCRALKPAKICAGLDKRPAGLPTI
jgi:hypothetical protein